MNKSSNYINRELSWLEFNQRVLDQANDPANPLLERVKFLAITGSNLDEFFRVRVGSLDILSEADPQATDSVGLTAIQQLELISQRVRTMNSGQSQILLDEIQPRLQQHGIVRLAASQLSEKQIAHLKNRFAGEISSAIAPIAVSRGEDFPIMLSAKLCMCVRIAFDERKVLAASNDEKEPAYRFVIIPLHGSLPRFVPLPCESGFDYMMLEEAVGLFLKDLLPGQEVLDWTVFRITRNADIALDDDSHDLLAEMTEFLQKRKIGAVIRFEIQESTSPETLGFLKQTLALRERDVYQIRGPLNLTDFFKLAGVVGFSDIKDEPWPPQPSPDFASGEDIFAVVAAGDRLLIHPYQSYDPVVEFLRSAARDPDVIAIKQTLYRTSRESEIIEALSQAAENGKQVTVVIELKARFDEERNILGAKQLEQAGVDVIYGVHRLKTHAKICIVVRKEQRGIQRYVHFGTGNYNESTARLYSDISYFTNHQQLGMDAVHFFNSITGLSVPQNLELLSAAPIDLRETIYDLIQTEIQTAKRGGAAEINAKLNSLVDRGIIDHLYAASKAGVKVRLNIRGICCLRPGVEGLSENIEVVSIVDRLLEHARIFHFNHGGDDLVYIASADWMPRNLDRRVELLVPIEDKSCKLRLLRNLNDYFKDNVRSSTLDSQGHYTRKQPGENPVRVQESLYREACDMYNAFTNPKATVFKAHRGESA